MDIEVTINLSNVTDEERKRFEAWLETVLLAYDKANPGHDIDFSSQIK